MERGWQQSGGSTYLKPIFMVLLPYVSVTPLNCEHADADCHTEVHARKNSVDDGAAVMTDA